MRTYEMPMRQDYHERIQTIFALLAQENIQRGGEPVNKQDRITNRKLNIVRTLASATAQTHKYPMEGLTACLATTYHQVGNCMELSQRFCFEYIKRYGDQQVALLFIHNDSNVHENHAIVMVGPFVDTRFNERLITGRSNCLINPSQAVDLQTFLQNQHPECFFVDPFLLSVSTQANTLSVESVKYCERYGLTNVVAMKSYHTTVSLSQNISVVEQNARILAAEIATVLNLKGTEQSTPEVSRACAKHGLFPSNDVQALVKKYAKNKDPGKAIRNAANQGNLEDLKKLLAVYKDKINEAGYESGQTGLHRAVVGKHDAVVSFLIEQGADPDKKDNTGKSAMDYAGTLLSVP